MGVKLEMLRMFLYLSFPVGVFWVSNQAEFFERHVIERKREIFPPDDPERRRAMAELKRRLREGKGAQA
ncbi:protein PET100 homolog, mitochondrial [Myiozetetes cayanensis]|uniref:protein PET100 homolog, mitochondrial n=1 Tax=Myiozetetes cayanensis TaxID=478635 RepID=UPI002160ED95|nr:protein PET100 homolog, mitochondrial [Myiozetetes cayanensis]